MVITKVKNKNKKHSKKHSKKFAKNRKNKSMKKNMKGGSNGNAEPLSRVQQMVKDMRSKGAEIGDRLSSTRPGYGEIMSRIVKPTKPLLGNINFEDLRSLDGQPIPESLKKIFKNQKPAGTSSKQKALDLLKQYHNSQTESSVTPSPQARQMISVPRSVALRAIDAQQAQKSLDPRNLMLTQQESISTPTRFGTPSVPQLVPRFSPPMMTPSASASALKMHGAPSSASSFKQKFKP